MSMPRLSGSWKSWESMKEAVPYHLLKEKKKAIVLSLSLKYMKCKLLVMMPGLKEESHIFGYQRQLYSTTVSITVPGTYFTSASFGPYIVSERESSLYFISSTNSGEYLSSNVTWYIVLASTLSREIAKQACYLYVFSQESAIKSHTNLQLRLVHRIGYQAVANSGLERFQISIEDFKYQ